MSEISKPPSWEFGVPFWIGYVVSSVGWFILAFGRHILDDNPGFWLNVLLVCIGLGVVAPFGGVLLQTAYNLFLALRQGQLRFRHIALVLAIAAACLLIGYLNYITQNQEMDVGTSKALDNSRFVCRCLMVEGYENYERTYQFYLKEVWRPDPDFPPEYYVSTNLYRGYLKTNHSSSEVVLYYDTELHWRGVAAINGMPRVPSLGNLPLERIKAYVQGQTRSKPHGAVNGSQRSRLETHRTSGAAGSRR